MYGRFACLSAFGVFCNCLCVKYLSQSLQMTVEQLKLSHIVELEDVLYGLSVLIVSIWRRQFTVW